MSKAVRWCVISGTGTPAFILNGSTIVGAIILIAAVVDEWLARRRRGR